MLEFKSKVREWGRSLGVVLPKEDAKREGIEKDDIVTILISKKKAVLEETFGTLNFKRTTEEILEESDKEDWND